jgi:hypothetical protein
MEADNSKKKIKKEDHKGLQELWEEIEKKENFEEEFKKMKKLSEEEQEEE